MAEHNAANSYQILQEGHTAHPCLPACLNLLGRPAAAAVVGQSPRVRNGLAAWDKRAPSTLASLGRVKAQVISLEAHALTTTFIN